MLAEERKLDDVQFFGFEVMPITASYSPMARVIV
jgi:hypothetical protein